MLIFKNSPQTNHFQVEKDENKTIHKCHLCGKLMSSFVNLIYHVSKNVCRKPDRICPLCGKIFSSKQNCQYHIS